MTAVRTTVQQNRLPDRVRRPAEAPLPQSVAEHDDVITARRALGGRERAASERGHGERLEQVRRRRRGTHALGFLPAGQARVHLHVRREVREARRPGSIVHDFLHRQPGRVARRRCVPDHDQPIGISVGQRLEEDGLDEAEKRGVRADAERERQDGDGGEAGLSTETLQGLFDVRHHNLWLDEARERRVGGNCRILLIRGPPRRDIELRE